MFIIIYELCRGLNKISIVTLVECTQCTAIIVNETNHTAD